uniref:serine/threonine-protein kinase CDG1-like n=1 Tax=Erigeron canadensis TaxID=72917 RepID=UPI001CB94510|nr:serine/threonine-protein kinase CDG1-like [Erigeron canadensis]
MASNTVSEFAHLKIPLEEIVKATDNFSEESIIGKGGFGNVYKGKIMRSGTLINISARRLDRRYGQGDVEFWTEISVLSSLKHINLVRLIGYCDERNEKIIITEYYPKGSLSMHLTDTTNLDWLKRIEISRAIADAIQDLQENIGQSNYYVIHRNINSSTVLLDDNWIPKLSGFEFSIKHPKDRKNHVFRCEAIGTKGYMDPEIEKTGGVTHKSDIYALGVVLFEVMCGRKAFDPKDKDMFLAPLVKFHYENDTLKDIINPDLWDQMEPERESFVRFSKAAYHCLQEERAQRSDAKLVMKQIKIAYDYADPFEPEILH